MLRIVKVSFDDTNHVGPFNPASQLPAATAGAVRQCRWTRCWAATWTSRSWTLRFARTTWLGRLCLRLSATARLLRTAAITAAVTAIAAATLTIAATAATTAQLDWLRFGFRIRFEAFDEFDWNFALDEAFDVVQKIMLIDADQRHGRAGSASAAGAADTMDVIFRHIRQIVIDHVRQLVDVDAACGDIGRNQGLQFTVLEFTQGTGTRSLALVAVDCHGGDIVALKLFYQLVGAMLGTGKHQHLIPGIGLHQMRQQWMLFVASNRMDLLTDHFYGRVAARHFDHGRCVEQAIGQRLDFVGEGRREQQVLTLLRQCCQHFTDVADETHVEHAVGFVEYQNLHVAQIDSVLLHVVEQAARCGHQDVNALLELADLWVDTDATEDAGRGQRQILAVDAHAFFDLRCQLTGRCQNQGTDRHMTVDLDAFDAGQPLQQRQGETRSFTGAGLCTSEQITSGQNGRHGLQLDWGGSGIALFGNGTNDFLGKTER